MNKITTYFFNRQNQLVEVNWFRKALYLFLIYKAITYVYFFDELFSNESFIYHHVQFTDVLQNASYALNNFYTPVLGAVSITLMALLSLLGLFRLSNYVTNALLWYVVLNVSYFLYPTLTGGDYLLNQLLLFNVFLTSKKTQHTFKMVFHNVGLVAIKIQVCLAYFLAGLYKLLDASWLSGTAVYDTIQIPEYSNALLVSIPFVLWVIINYLTIIYQLCFPVLVWLPRTKLYILAFGFTQHLLIAFAMGIFSFGILMLITYFLFLKYDEAPIRRH